MSENDRKLGKSLSLQIESKYVYIYRACKKDQNYFNDMDYITLSKNFAIIHAEHMHVVDEEHYHVIKAFVSTNDVYSAPNTDEYYYHDNKNGSIVGKEVYVSLGDDYEG